MRALRASTVSADEWCQSLPYQQNIHRLPPACFRRKDQVDFMSAEGAGGGGTSVKAKPQLLTRLTCVTRAHHRKKAVPKQPLTPHAPWNLCDRALEI